MPLKFPGIDQRLIAFLEIFPSPMIPSYNNIFRHMMLTFGNSELDTFNCHFLRWGESNKTELGNLARYIIRECFSQERMIYIPVDESTDGIARVVYISKDKKSRKAFTALDWLAQLVTHIHGRYEQAVRDYGFYSNKSRGLRKKANTDDNMPAVIPNEMSSKSRQMSESIRDASRRKQLIKSFK